MMHGISMKYGYQQTSPPPPGVRAPKLVGTPKWPTNSQADEKPPRVPCHALCGTCLRVRVANTHVLRTISMYFAALGPRPGGDAQVHTPACLSLCTIFAKTAPRFRLKWHLGAVFPKAARRCMLAETAPRFRLNWHLGAISAKTAMSESEGKTSWKKKGKSIMYPPPQG